MEQVAGEGGACPALLRHSLPASGLETEDAVLARDVARHGDTALPRVGGRHPSSSDGHTGATGAISHVVHGLGGGSGVGILGLGGASVAIHGIGRRAVTSVEAAVAAKEVVVAGVGLVARSTRQGVGHSERSRHDGESGDSGERLREYRDSARSKFGTAVGRGSSVSWSDSLAIVCSESVDLVKKVG